MSYKTPREIDAMREAVQQNIQATRRYVKEQKIKSQEPTDYLFGAINQHAKQAVKLYPVEEAVAVPIPTKRAEPEHTGFWDGVGAGAFMAATIGLIGAVIGVVFVL